MTNYCLYCGTGGEGAGGVDLLAAAGRRRRRTFYSRRKSAEKKLRLAGGQPKTVRRKSAIRFPNASLT